VQIILLETDMRKKRKNEHTNLNISNDFKDKKILQNVDSSSQLKEKLKVD
jgi:hypothetical protein